MKKLLAIAKLSFRSQAIYRANHYLYMAYELVDLLIRLVIWFALYGSANTTSVQGQSIQDIMTYIVLSSLTGILINVGFSREMAEALRSGSIATDLLRPLTARGVFIARAFGQSLHGLWLRLLPLLLVSGFLIRYLIPPASLAHFVLFLLSLLLGFLLVLSLELIQSMLLFWLKYVWLTRWILQAIHVVFSGSVVPLWFYPPWLAGIARVLPFQAAYFLPVEIYLGQIPLSHIAGAFMTQAAWIVVLFIVQEMLWRRGMRRITVYGG